MKQKMVFYSSKRDVCANKIQKKNQIWIFLLFIVTEAHTPQKKENKRKKNTSTNKRLISAYRSVKCVILTFFISNL